jgi:hypothetical protein
MDLREQNYNAKTRDQFAYPPMSTPGDKRGAVNIRQCDPLMTFKEVTRGTVDVMGSTSAQSLPNVFSSWNGLVVSDLPPNASRLEQLGAQARMYDEYIAFGYAETTYTYDELSQPDTGMTSRVGGSFSVPVTGTKTFHPGDRVVATIPPCGEKPLAEFKEEQRVAMSASAPIMETLTILEPLTPEIGGEQLVLMEAGRLYKKASGADATAKRLALVEYFNKEFKDLNRADPFVRLMRAVSRGADEAAKISYAADAIIDYSVNQTASEMNNVLEIANACFAFSQRISERIAGVACSYGPPGGRVVIAL